jgi:hypothetical protein
LLAIFQAFNSLFVVFNSLVVADDDVRHPRHYVLEFGDGLVDVCGVFGHPLFEIFVQMRYYFQVHGECFESLVYGHLAGLFRGLACPSSFRLSHPCKGISGIEPAVPAPVQLGGDLAGQPGG